MAAALWIVAAVLYVGTEAVVARAFSPSYDYARNYISDLGVPVCGTLFAGRSICSPLHGAMNANFALQGMLFLAAALVLASLLSRPAAYAFVACAALNGIGNSLVALFPETSRTLDGGVSHSHVAGAFLAIVFGNGAALVSAFAFKDLRLAPIHRYASIALALIGWLALVTLVTAPGFLFPDGVWERLSVYTITAWEVLSAVCLLAWRIRSEHLVTSGTSQ